MKQVTQSMKDGTIRVLDVPIPALGAHNVLVRVVRSLVSVGTERSKVELGRSSLIEKARKRPDDVRKVLDRVRRDGLLGTYKMVMDRLEQASPLGYSISGVVEAVGELVAGVQPGDHVACAGAGYANHAEYVSVPGSLCVRIPDGVEFDQAAYSTLGAIAMQGFRQAQPSVGDTVGVIGLGLLGLITVQIAKAAGCVVVGFDPDEERTKLAESLGVDAAAAGGTDEFAGQVERLSHGLGADAVIITASTRSSDPVNLAAEVARDRGVVVVVGDVGMDLSRAPYYGKELSLRLSRSYGPGRYDPSYEEYGIDYPEGYVKWTERRNMEEFLRLVSTKAVDTTTLTTHRFSIDEAPKAYDLIVTPGEQEVIGVLLEYASAPGAAADLSAPARPARKQKESVAIGMVGAGNFATSTLLPALSGLPGVELRGIVTASGLRAEDAAARHGFAYAAASVDDLLDDDATDAVIVATRHDTHARFVVAGLSRGKDVFVEKPLALTREELDDVIRAAAGADGASVMVGFNRRYSPAAVAVRAQIRQRAAVPLIQIRVNAGEIAADHWIQRLEEGGGRIVGEVCHFVDLACFLAGSRPTSVHAYGLSNGKPPALQDSLVCSMQFASGAVASITYASGGDTAYPKELVEVFCGGSTLVIDDFRRLTHVESGKTQRKDYGKVDKGHAEEMATFVRLAGGKSEDAETLDEAVETTRATLAIVESLSTGVPILLSGPRGDS